MPVGVGWTLNYEMYFYAVFAASMLFARWRWPAFFGWIAATLLLLPYCAGHLVTPADWASLLGSGNAHRFGLHYLDLMTNPLILMFVAGVAIGLIHHSRLAIENVRVLSCASRQLHAQYCNTRRNGVSDTASANGGFRWYR